MTHQSLARSPRATTPKTPKIAPCDGCGAKVPRRDLIELVEGEHDGLTHFDGDELCRACACGHGAL